MSDETSTREERIAEAEAEQDRLHTDGGTVEERIARLKALGDQIADTADDPTGVEPPK